MLYVNATPGKAGAVNLRELAEVRQHHMPAPAVRFASPAELHRVAEEVTRQHPQLAEETSFVVQEELGRRHQLGTIMQAVKGGQRRG